MEQLDMTSKMKSELLKKRTYAFSLDMALVLLLNKAITLSYTNFLRTVFYQLAPQTQTKVLLSYNYVTLSTLWIVFWAYFVLSYYLGQGKTPGKLIFEIQTFSKKTNDGLTLTESLVRTMGHFVCMITGLFLFALPYLRKDQKSLADIISDTWVANETEEAQLAPVIELQQTQTEENKAA